MNYLGIDHGSKRIGLSFANFLNISMPLKPIIVINITTSIDQILNIINEKNINKIIIGWPIYNDKTNNQTRAVENFIKNLSNL
nr:Holliday junction resolvase RuvX [Alteromonas macleodii]